MSTPGGLDRARARSAQLYSATNATVGDEPLIVDFFQPGGTSQSQHWMLWGVTLIATLTTRQPDIRGVPPGTGLYLCPPGTPSESLTEAQSGLVTAARPFPLPLADPYINVQQVGAIPTFAVSIVSQVGRLIVLPKQWFVRAIVVCQQGSVTPGPGVGSRGILSVLASIEDDIYCP